jgi:hypothetical protein
MVKLLRDREGSMVVERQGGNLVSGEHEHRRGGTVLRHNGESFKKMWEVVGEATGTKWRVEVEMIAHDREYLKEGANIHNSNGRRLRFSVFGNKRFSLFHRFYIGQQL